MSRVEAIGNATLYLGDCREITSTVSYDSILSDPPYGMGFQSNYRKEQYRNIENDHNDILLLWACDLTPSHSSYLFCRWDNLQSVPKPKSCVTWVKNNWSMGDLNHEHARQTEIALFYPGPDHYFPNGRPQDVVTSQRTGNKDHPTEKPVNLMQKFLNWSVGTVFDPFMGSGSTGVAAVLNNRKFIGIELDEKYFDIACERIDVAQRQGRIEL